MSMSFQTALTTMALRTALGSPESAGAMARMTTRDSTTAVMPAIRVRQRALQTAAVLDRLAATPMRPEQAGSEVGHAEGEQLLVGVDAVAAAGGEQPGSAQPLRETHQRQGRAAAEQRREVADSHRQQPGCRQHSRHRPDDLDAPRLKIQCGGGDETTDEERQPPTASTERTALRADRCGSPE